MSGYKYLQFLLNHQTDKLFATPSKSILALIFNLKCTQVIDHINSFKKIVSIILSFINRFRVMMTIINSNIFTVQPAGSHCSKKSFGMETKDSGVIDPGKKNISNVGWIAPSKEEVKTTGKSETKYIHALYGILALLILTSSSISSTLIPVHNTIINPEYWYEIIFSSFSSSIFLATCGTLGAEAMSIPFKKCRVFVILDVIITFNIALAFLVGFTHIVWTQILGYFEPFPNRGMMHYTVPT